VTQGRNEAKVRLDFTVGGAAYSVARVVRGASSRRAGQVPASFPAGFVHKQRPERGLEGAEGPPEVAFLQQAFPNLPREALP
jgi:hypothetical protein